MKLIFLDIDGVLNTDFYLKESDRHVGPEFYPGAIKLLEEVIVETDAKVVISSTWRHGTSKKELVDLFRNYSDIIANAIIGKTGYYPSISRDRWVEILFYIAYLLKKGKNVTNIVILDDDYFDLEPLSEYLVLCRKNNMRGLRYHMKHEVMKKLKSRFFIEFRGYENKNS